MARDGTNRGGARPGAGRPRKALAEKLAEGKTAEVMMQPADIGCVIRTDNIRTIKINAFIFKIF